MRDPCRSASEIGQPFVDSLKTQGLPTGTPLRNVSNRRLKHDYVSKSEVALSTRPLLYSDCLYSIKGSSQVTDWGDGSQTEVMVPRRPRPSAGSLFKHVEVSSRCWDNSCLLARVPRSDVGPLDPYRVH